MIPREAGFLLLCSHLGDPDRHPLTQAQLRNLAHRVSRWDRPAEDRDLTAEDIVSLGYGWDMARRIVSLLEEGELLEHYLRRGAHEGCCPVSMVSEEYPARLKQALGYDAPGCLWAKGDISLLNSPRISLVGSRELLEDNRNFARQVGIQAARQGYTLVSGNARGADRIAQEACLASGGRVISVVADELIRHPVRDRLLLLSEDGFEESFSAQRALSRNRVIHGLGQVTFAAQCSYQTGGTWSGSTHNLRHDLSPLYCFDDGTPAMAALADMGANLISVSQLEDISALLQDEDNFLAR